MAAVTTAAIGAATAGFQIYKGVQDSKNAKRALDNFRPQELENSYENMPISTVGSDYMREQSSINNANMVDAARNGGTRGIYGAIPQIVEASNKANRETMNYLDNQVTKRDYAIAGDEVAIRGIQENRDNASLEGIGNLMEVGRQNMFSGIRGAGAAAMYAANNVDWKGEGSQAEKDAKLFNNSKNNVPGGIGYTPSYLSMLPKLKGY
jgi:hypothetical protein